MSNKFYLTTPLYYVNDIPHIGHSYTTIAADVLARYMREIKEQDVFFLTGTDEHGQKIADAAREQDLDIQAYVDKIVGRFKDAWEKLGIKYDHFIRTTDKDHVNTVQSIFKKLMDQGDIYLGEYEGWYCTPCESFWTEMHLKQATGQYVCPDCGRPVEKIKEKTYFFKQSKYQDKLLGHINSNPGFIQPLSRSNEIEMFIKQGLKDLSVTRTTFTWGVPVPGDDKHVIYVWFDALINYISALQYPDGERFKKYWPADVHLMGKEIVRFHAITWPCMLMALGLSLPKKVFGHGWWTVEGQKMSKSKGNVVDPVELADRFGVEAVRYFVLREVPFGVDGDLSMRAFILRYNADLANDFGNLVHRSLNMVEKYFNGIVPVPKKPDFDKESADLILAADNSAAAVDKHMENLAFSEALAQIWQVINKANTYIEKQAPWKLSKEAKNDELGSVMFNLMEVIRIVAILVSPFMPSTAVSILSQLGASQIKGSSFGMKIAGVKVSKGLPLFPRVETR